jgi:predicted RNase H-like HicB family nuclease
LNNKDRAKKMNRYLIVIEETKTGFSAYSPDLDGCIATGATRDEVEQTMKEAIKFHLEGLKEEHLPIPMPHSSSTYLEISA